MEQEIKKNRLFKGLLLSCGLVSLLLAIIGVILPLVPATPFLLLAAACFTRSSPALQRWLEQSPVLGELLRSYRNKNGLPRSTKIGILIVLWSSLTPSVLFLIPPHLMPLKLLLISIGLMVSVGIWKLKSNE